VAQERQAAERNFSENFIFQALCAMNPGVKLAFTCLSCVPNSVIPITMMMLQNVPTF